MEDCWRHDPLDRPAVTEIITRLGSAIRRDGRPGGGWEGNMSPSYFRNVVHGGQYHPSLDDVETILCGFV